LKQIDFIGLRFQLPTSIFELRASLCELRPDKTTRKDDGTRHPNKKELQGQMIDDFQLKIQSSILNWVRVLSASGVIFHQKFSYTKSGNVFKKLVC